MLLDLFDLPIFLVLSEILAPLDLLKILDQPKILWFCKISPSNYWRVNIPFTLGQLFRSVPNLKQYVVAKLALRRRIVAMSKPNLVIALVALILTRL
jgi:hypothetical protein